MQGKRVSVQKPLESVLEEIPEEEIKELLRDELFLEQLHSVQHHFWPQVRSIV